MLMMSQTYIKLINFNVNENSRNMATTDVDRRFESVRTKLRHIVKFERATLRHTIKLELVVDNT